MLNELKTIIEIEGIEREDGLEARRKALEHWISKYVDEIQVENTVIKKRLTSEQTDFLKYHIGLQIAEKIIEDHALVVEEGNKIRVKLLVLKKDYPRNKE